MAAVDKRQSQANFDKLLMIAHSSRDDWMHAGERRVDVLL